MDNDLPDIGDSDEYVFQNNSMGSELFGECGNTFSAKEAITKETIHELRRLASSGSPLPELLECALLAFREHGLLLGTQRTNWVLGYKIACLFSAAFGQSMFSYKWILGWTSGTLSIESLEAEILPLVHANYDHWKNYM